MKSGTSIPDCSICYEPYSSNGLSVPLLLNCGHDYCQKCVTKLCVSVINASRETYTTISCPECRSHTNIRTINDLKKNFTVIRMIDNSTQSSPQKQPKQQLKRCTEHDEPLKLFCIQCDKLICLLCRDYGTHKTHKIDLVTNFVTELRNNYFISIQQVREKQETIHKTIMQLENAPQDVQFESNICKAKVNEYALEQIEAFHEWNVEILKQIDEKTNLKLQDIAKEKQLFEQQLRNSKTVLQEFEKDLKTDDITFIELRNKFEAYLHQAKLDFLDYNITVHTDLNVKLPKSFSRKLFPQTSIKNSPTIQTHSTPRNMDNTSTTTITSNEIYNSHNIPLHHHPRALSAFTAEEELREHLPYINFLPVYNSAWINQQSEINTDSRNLLSFTSLPTTQAFAAANNNVFRLP